MKYARRKFKRRFNRRRTFKRAGRLRYAKGKVQPSRYARKMGRVLNMFAEKKITSVENGTFSIDNAGDNIIMIPAVAQGAAGNQRIGNKIFVRYIISELIIRVVNVTMPGYEGMIRFSVVVPKDKSWGVIGDMPTTSFIQDWDTEKFTVLKDFIIRLDNAIAYSAVPIQGHSEPSYKHMKFKIPWFKSIEYAGTTIVSPTPHLFIWSSNASAAASKPTYELKSKVTFSDA